MHLRSKLLDDAGFLHAFGARDAGDREIASTLGVDRVVQTTQVHGARVVPADAAPGEAADAVVARGGSSPVAVGVRVADCVPVLLADARSGDVAAVHAGWRGVVAGVVPAAVAALGPAPSLVAAVGPCIGACCFEVGLDVAELIARACEEPSVVARARGEKRYVDLRAAVRAQLRASGLADARIEDVAGCTMHEAHFHSYRRDGKASGRMLAAIATRR